MFANCALLCGMIRRGVIRRSLLPALLLSGWVAAAPVCAQESEVAQLRQQTEQLRAQLARVDARLRELEAVPSRAAAAPSAPAPAIAAAAPAAPAAAAVALSAAPAAIPAARSAEAESGFSPAERATLRDQAQTGSALQRWTELHTGMSQDEVRSRLGAPQSVVPVDNRTGWVYRYARAGTGSVFFDHSGRVISLMAPGQGVLHLY